MNFDTDAVDLFIIDGGDRHHVDDYEFEQIENEMVQKPHEAGVPPAYKLTIMWDETRPPWIGSFPGQNRVTCEFKNEDGLAASYDGSVVRLEDGEDLQKGRHEGEIQIRFPAGGGVPWDDFDLRRVFGEDRPA